MSLSNDALPFLRLARAMIDKSGLGPARQKLGASVRPFRLYSEKNQPRH